MSRSTAGTPTKAHSGPVRTSTRTAPAFCISRSIGLGGSKVTRSGMNQSFVNPNEGNRLGQTPGHATAKLFHSAQVSGWPPS